MNFSVLILIILFLIFIGFINNWIFDQILQIQYKNHYKLWEEDGKPRGFSFIPKEIKSSRWNQFDESSVSFMNLTISWFMETPNWAKTDRKVLRLLFWYRILLSMCLFRGLTAFFTFAYFNK